MRDPVSVPVDPEVLARALNRRDDFRVLRSARPMTRLSAGGVPVGGMTGVALSVAASGPDPGRHELLQLALQTFVMDSRSRIVATGALRTWSEPPSDALPAGRLWPTWNGTARPGTAIADGEATSMIVSADFVVSYRAGASRPFVERRLPLAAGRPWACVRTDPEWAAFGFGDTEFQALLASAGWFVGSEEPASRVVGLLHLLDHRLDGGGTVAGRLVERATRTTWIVEVADVPITAVEVLVDRGYAWNGVRSSWSASIEDRVIGDEVRWAKIMLYGGRREPMVSRTTWVERHAERK